MTLIEMQDLEQGSEQWLAARRGMVTASTVGQLITIQPPGALDFTCPSCESVAQEPCRSKVKKAGETGVPLKNVHTERTAHATAHKHEVPSKIVVADNEGSRGLTALLVAERISGYTEPTFMTDDMFRGVMDEPRARDLYSEKYTPATETGFMVEDGWGFKIGFSPDGLVGDDGLVADAGLLEVKSRRGKKQLLTILADEVPAENMAQLQCGLLVSGRKWIDYVSYSGGWPMWKKRVYADQRWFDAIVAAVRAFEDRATEMTDAYFKAVEGLPMTERIDYNEVELTL